MKFCSQLPELYVIMYVCSFRVLTYGCTLVPMATPFLNHIPFCRGSSLSLYAHTVWFSLCRYVQMDNIGSASANVEAWTLVNDLEEGWFPALLWDTLKDFGYTAYPEDSTCEVMTTGQFLRCEVKVKISMCPTNPAWKEWECKAQGLNLADTVQKAALCQMVRSGQPTGVLILVVYLFGGEIGS
jgi:hypothetical protein